MFTWTDFWNARISDNLLYVTVKINADMNCFQGSFSENILNRPFFFIIYNIEFHNYTFITLTYIFKHQYTFYVYVEYVYINHTLTKKGL